WKPSPALTNRTERTPRRASLPVDRHDLDRLGDALRGDLTRLGEREPRLGGRVPAGQDLPALGQAGDASRLVDSLAREVPTHLGRAGRVDTDPNLWRKPLALSMFGQPPLDGHGAGQSLLRGVEPDEEA